jgi:C-terminal processing protease CtpA/Prc
VISRSPIARAGGVALVAALAACSPCSAARTPSSTVTSGAGCAHEHASTGDDWSADFEQLWTELEEGYAYFDEKRTDWAAVRQRLAGRARAVTSRADFVALLEEAMDALYDPHATLGTNTPHSFRLVPTGADVWAEIRDGRAVVTEVRPGGAAEAAGLHAEDEVVAIGGLPWSQAVDARAPRSLRSPDPAARAHALLQLLAGRHDEPRRLTIATRAGSREVVLTDDAAAASAPAASLVTSRRLEDGTGYVRIDNALGDDALVPAFDAALADLAGCPALVLDLRDTPSGGNTGVAEAILGRFVPTERPYQKYVEPKAGWGGRDRTWVQYVEPRGPFAYGGRLAVLVDHWTGSMGEGMAIGLDGMKRATVVGTRMARLHGATHTATLARSGITFGYPAERLFHVDGTPRERFEPTVSVDLAGEDGAGRDPILARALDVLRRR